MVLLISYQSIGRTLFSSLVACSELYVYLVDSGSRLLTLLSCWPNWVRWGRKSEKGFGTKTGVFLIITRTSVPARVMKLCLLCFCFAQRKRHLHICIDACLILLQNISRITFSSSSEVIYYIPIVPCGYLALFLCYSNQTAVPLQVLVQCLWALH